MVVPTIVLLRAFGCTSMSGSEFRGIELRPMRLWIA